jgi:FtsH-binding integral membrane protein
MTQKQTPDQRESSLMTNWLLAIPLLCLAVAAAIYFGTPYGQDKQFILWAIISFTLSLLAGIYALIKKERPRPGATVFILFFIFFIIGQGLVVFIFLNKK